MQTKTVTDAQLAFEEKHVMHTFARYNVEFVRGEGARLWDVEGNEYLDFLAGIAVCSLGHCNKAVVSAIQAQAEKLMHVSNYFYVQQRGEVAQKISDLLNFGSENPRDWKVFFTNSGAESNECALKIARFLGNKKHGNDGSHCKVVVLKNSFHGRTFETLAATAQDRFHTGLSPMSPVFLEVQANNTEELQQLFASQGDAISAMIFEPIQGESGVHPLSAEFVQLARKLTAENEALLICDEVQTGVYRTGAPFAFQLCDVCPDVVTVAKGIGDGFPCGLCAATGEAAEVLQPGDHGTTFGGSCLAMAAMNATLAELERLDVLDNVVQVSEYMKNKLECMSKVVEVRGKGLMLGAELESGIDAHDVVADALFKQHLVINATGPSTLRFLPPLTITKADVDEFAERLEAVV